MIEIVVLSLPVVVLGAVLAFGLKRTGWDEVTLVNEDGESTGSFSTRG